MGHVQIVRGGTWDAELVERELGVPPLDIDPVLAPVIVIDGQVEPDATQWLAEVHARTAATGTSLAYAESLVQFVSFLQARNSSLRGATRSHIVGYVNARTVNDATRVSGATWGRDRSTLKQFYVWLRETHGVALPITLDTIDTPRGPVESMREGRGVAKSSAAGTPLTPPLVGELNAAAWRVVRRQLLEVAPGNVRDLDAAAACECSCHPRPGEQGRHHGGLCQCQWTDQERAAHMAELIRLMEQHRPEQEALWRERDEAIAVAAAELQIEATEESPGAPWVIVGHVDGRRFYLRERWETYEIVISPADDPDLDPWRLDSGILVRDGVAGDLLTAGRVDYRRALRVVAEAVRNHLRRETCAHPHDDADRFCPACGLPMQDVAAPISPEPRGPEGELDDADDAAGWQSRRYLRAVAAARRTRQDADDHLRAVVFRARAAGDPWSLIALALHLDEKDAVRLFGDDPLIDPRTLG
jgi:hypothetical protein